MPGVGSLSTDVFHGEVWCSQCFPVQVCESVLFHCFDVLAAFGVLRKHGLVLGCE